MKNKGILIVVVFALAFLAIMWTSTRNLSAHRVEVCMEYQGVRHAGRLLGLQESRRSGQPAIMRAR